MSFDQLTNLSAVYQFAMGTCYGGSMRWSIGFADGSTIYVYYGKSSTFWQDCSSNTSDPSIDQSGLNMIKANFDLAGDDARYEIQGSVPQAYITYAAASAFATGRTISYVALVLDGGWHADQVVNLGFVTVNDNTFVPNSGNFSAVCPTAPATIQVSTIGSAGGLTVDESVTANGPDTGSLFRIVGCKYMYNINGKSLGAGQYQVDAIIGGTPAQQVYITKFALK
jgi:hypothetical protein